MSEYSSIVQNAKNFIRNNAHNFFILSLVFLKLLIVGVAFFLGHPVYEIYGNLLFAVKTKFVINFPLVPSPYIHVAHDRCHQYPANKTDFFFFFFFFFFPLPPSVFHHPYRRECFRDRAISTVREFDTNKAKGDGPPLFNSENLLCWWVSAPHFM